MNETIKIRKGQPEDLNAALNLIRELALYEKAPEEVEVGLDEMKNWGFGNEKIFDFLVLEKSSTIIGIAVYYYKYSTWKGKCIFLEDIIITEQERRKGYGKLLLNDVIKIAKHEKVRRLEWQVLEWNTPALEFYKGFGVTMDNEWVNCKLTYDQLQS